MSFRVRIFPFGYGAGKRSIAINEIESIVGQFPQVVTHWFIRAMNGGIQSRIVEIYPVRLIHTRLNLRVDRKCKSVWISGIDTGERHVCCVRRRDTVVAIWLGCATFATRYNHHANYA